MHLGHSLEVWLLGASELIYKFILPRKMRQRCPLVQRDRKVGHTTVVSVFEYAEAELKS